MDAAFEFSFTGMNMEFAIHLAADGHDIPRRSLCQYHDRKMSTSATTP